MIFLRGFPGRRPVRAALVIPLGRYLTFHSIVRSSRLKGNGLDLLPCLASDIKKDSRSGVLFFCLSILPSLFETNGALDFIDGGDPFDRLEYAVLSHIQDPLRFRCLFDLAFTRILAKDLFYGAIHEDAFVD